MNRKFLLPKTPEAARLLVLMAGVSPLSLADDVHELAAQDRASIPDMEKRGIVEAPEQQAVQFILDSNFRCGIPTMPEAPAYERGRLIVKTALELAEITTIATLRDNMVRIPMKTKPLPPSYQDLIPHRRDVLLVDIMENTDLTLVAKLFPRIVALGKISRQHSFNFGKETSITGIMGTVLYPGAAKSSLKTSRHFERSMLSMGVYPFLLEREAPDSPKNKMLDMLAQMQSNIETY